MGFRNPVLTAVDQTARDAAAAAAVPQTEIRTAETGPRAVLERFTGGARLRLFGADDDRPDSGPSTLYVSTTAGSGGARGSKVLNLIHGWVGASGNLAGLFLTVQKAFNPGTGTFSGPETAYAELSGDQLNLNAPVVMWQGQQQDLADTGWLDLVLKPGIVTGFGATPQARRRGGQVELQGVVQAGTSGGTTLASIAAGLSVATLPDALLYPLQTRRPLTATSAADTGRRLVVSTAGDVQANVSGGTAVTWQALDGAFWQK